MKALKLVGLLAAMLLAGQAVGQDRSGIEQIGRLYNHWVDAVHAVNQGSIVYIASEESGLQIVDVSDPAAPVQIGLFDVFQGITLRVEVVGDRAYVLHLPYGVLILDISEPSQPTLLGIVASDGEENRFDDPIAVKDDYLFVSNRIDDGFDLKIFDVSQPDALQETGSLHFPQPAEQMLVIGDVLYAACRDTGIVCIDVSDPYEPQIIGLLDPVEGIGARGFTLNDTLLYVAGYTGGVHHGLFIYNVVDPFEPEFLNYNDSLTIRTLVFGEDAAFSKSTGYYAFNVWDISDPVHLRLRREVRSNDRYPLLPGSLVINQNTAILAYDNLFTFDISNLDEPRRIATLVARGRVDDVVINGDYAYVADDYVGLHILDIQDPRRPIELGLYAARASNVAVSGNMAYVTGFGVLKAVDISDPTQPTVIGYYPEDRRPGSPVPNHPIVSGNYLYSPGGEGLFILNLSDPAHIARVDAPELNDFQMRDIVINEGYMYSVGDNLRIFALDNPERPQLLATEYVEEGAQYSVVVHNDYCYVGGHFGLAVFELIAPDAAWRANFIELTALTVDLKVEGETLYLYTRTSNDDRNCGIKLMDISEPSLPVEIGHYNTPGDGATYANRLAVRNGVVYLADRNCLGVYDCSEALGVSAPLPFAPYTLQLAPPFPNPFNSSTTISFSLPSASPSASLLVFDPLGRRVAELIPSRVMGAGRYRVQWDASGVAAGNYFIKLQGGGSELSRRITLVK